VAVAAAGIRRHVQCCAMMFLQDPGGAAWRFQALHLPLVLRH
jgi:hypothetical protein